MSDRLTVEDRQRQPLFTATLRPGLMLAVTHPGSDRSRLLFEVYADPRDRHGALRLVQRRQTLPINTA